MLLLLLSLLLLPLLLLPLLLLLPRCSEMAFCNPGRLKIEAGKGLLFFRFSIFYSYMYSMLLYVGCYAEM